MVHLCLTQLFPYYLVSHDPGVISKPSSSVVPTYDLSPLRSAIEPGQQAKPRRVQLYKEFAERRPRDCNTAESPFYIALNNVKERNETQAWFKKTAVGQNKLYRMMTNRPDKQGEHYKSLCKKNDDSEAE